MIANITLRRRAYEQLRDDLLDGKLPPGSRVSALKKAKELGISRGPVRDAVNQLASEGLIDQVPGLGAFVKIPDAREIADLYDFRDAMESFAASVAARRISPEQITTLEACGVEGLAILRRMFDKKQRDLDDMAAARWVAIDQRFHSTIVAAAQNPWITRHITDVHFLRQIWCQRLDPAQVDVRAILARSYRDHTRIVRAFKRGDGEAARRWMSQHIQSTKRNYVEQAEGVGATGRRWPRDWNPAASPQKLASARKRVRRTGRR